MPSCPSCGSILKGGERFCGKCGKAQVVNQVPTRHDSANRAVLASIVGVVIVGFLGVALFQRFGRNGQASSESSGWSGIYDCVSTSGPTRGMSYVMTLNNDGSVSLSGLQQALWFEDAEIGESPKSDITVMGTSGNGESALFRYHKTLRDGKLTLVGHNTGMSCSKR